MPTHVYYIIIDFFDGNGDGLLRFTCKEEYYDLEDAKSRALTYARSIEAGFLYFDGFDCPDEAESVFISVVRQVWGFTDPETESEVYTLQISDLQKWHNFRQSMEAEYKRFEVRSGAARWIVRD